MLKSTVYIGTITQNGVVTHISNSYIYTPKIKNKKNEKTTKQKEN